MHPSELRELLEQVRLGHLDADLAHERLLAAWRRQPFEDLGFARIDHHRPLRTGFPEVVFGPGKSPEQIAAIAERIVASGENLLVTRTDQAAHEAVAARMPAAVFHAQARAITLRQREMPAGNGTILVVAAGTSDVPVAEEAAVTADLMGNHVERLYDVGVAGIHRLLREEARLTAARVIVAVAGMEGALPSVVGGLVRVPVIAVPTSVGYGVGLGGLAALMGMLNSCAPGLAVVNIDNGFGAAAIASLINHV